MAKESLLSGRLSHVTLCVHDVAAAHAFYVGVLGLSTAPRPDLPVPGLWLNADDLQIHLLVPIDARELPSRTELRETPIAAHLAFHVDDLDATIIKLEAAGVVTVRSAFIAGQAFTLDPSGNIIEFNEPARTNTHSSP